MRQIDLTGQRFGRLVVVHKVDSYVSPTGHKQTRWKCQCDCGNTSICTTGNLRKGDCLSCGCLGREQRIKTTTKHGGRHSRLYGVWCNMKNRCLNKKVRSYKDYGGRGITVCEEWIHDFERFREWSMKTGYDISAPYGQCTLDRIDVNSGYSPDNCRWVDAKIQANNRRKNGGNNHGHGRRNDDGRAH